MNYYITAERSTPFNQDLYNYINQVVLKHDMVNNFKTTKFLNFKYYPITKADSYRYCFVYKKCFILCENIYFIHDALRYNKVYQKPAENIIKGVALLSGSICIVKQGCNICYFNSSIKSVDESRIYYIFLIDELDNFEMAQGYKQEASVRVLLNKPDAYCFCLDECIIPYQFSDNIALGTAGRPVHNYYVNGFELEPISNL